MSPGAVIDGVTPTFSWKKTDFFSHRRLQSDDLLAADLVCPLFFLNSATLFISVGCHPGRSASPSDATDQTSHYIS